MLTGDKVETAICISISTGIKQPNEQLFIIKEQKDVLELQNLINEFSKNAQNQVRR
jgi:phospholipid-translocating ATPase